MAKKEILDKLSIYVPQKKITECPVERLIKLSEKPVIRLSPCVTHEEKMVYTHIHDPELEDALKSFRQATAVGV